jgi:hypothetical protein
MTAMPQRLDGMILPPPVTPSDEEPIAAGGWQPFNGSDEVSLDRMILPPPVTPSDEEPIAAGVRQIELAEKFVVRS